MGDAPAIDLRTLLSEMAALRAEVRKQTEITRVVTAQAEHAAPPGAGDAPAMRVIIELIDRIEAARHSLLAPAPRRWFTRSDPRVAALADGLAMTQARALSDLASLGVQRLETSGAFDAEYMEALDVVAGGPPGQVAREILSGYRRDGVVLRAAQVAVYRAVKEDP